MGVTNQAIDHILNAEFASGPRFSRWYLGLLVGGIHTVLRATDTANSLSQHTQYGNGEDRMAWGASLGSAGFGNATPVLFYPTAPLIVMGIVLAARSKSTGFQGDGDLLFASLAFDGGDKEVAPPDSLSVQVTIAVSS